MVFDRADDRPAARELLANIKHEQARLADLLEDATRQSEDHIYRFWHQSMGSWSDGTPAHEMCIDDDPPEGAPCRWGRWSCHRRSCRRRTGAFAGPLAGS